MKKNLLILYLFILLFFTGKSFADGFNLIGGHLQYSDGSFPADVDWNAYISTSPGTQIHKDAPGSKYDAVLHEFSIQLKDQLTWNAGDVLHIDIFDGSGGTVSTDVTLDNSGGQDVGTLTLIRPSHDITVTTSPAGRAFVVDGTTYTSSQTFPWEQGSSHSIQVANETQSGATGIQYVFDAWSNTSSNPQTYVVGSSNATITGNFDTQYYLTVNSAHGSATGQGWKNAGTFAGVSVTSPDGTSGTRYVLDSWSGDHTGSETSFNITMNSPKTVTAAWTTQYYLTTAVNPPAGGTISEDSGWHDSGTVLSINTTTNSGYQWAGFTGALTGKTLPQNLTMNSAKSVTANFGTEVDITINTSPSGLDFEVDGTTYTAPHTFTWVSSETHTLEVESTTQSGGAGTQYVFYNWGNTGTNPQTYTVPSTNQTVTANFTTQYQLIVNSDHGNPQGAGWHNGGTTPTVSVTTPDGDSETRYVLSGWSGDHTGTESSYTITMNGPKTVTAAWTTQYYLDVVSDHGSPTGEAWYNSGASATFGVTTPDVSTGTQHLFQSWSGAYSGTDASHSFTMDGPKTVTAAWQTQYYLTMTENPDAGGNTTPAPPGQWYNAGATANISTTVAGGYDFVGWTGSLSGTTTPTSLLMDAPKSVTANYNLVVDVTVNTSIAGLDFTVDGVTYSTPQTFSWVVGSNHTLTTDAIQEVGELTYVFTSWSDAGARSHTYTVPGTGQTVTANFEEKREATLTMARNVNTWGTTSPAIGNHVYDIGDQVPIQAFPAEGFRFKYWSSNVEDPYNPNTTVFIDNDKTVLAVFGKQDFTLTMVADPAEGGTTDPEPGEHTYNTYSLVDLTAIPNAGYRFVGWSNNVDDTTSASSTIRIIQDETVTAKFEKITYTLNIGPDPVGGGTTVPTAGEYDYDSGAVVNISATALSGYRFVKWSGGVTDSTKASTTVVMSKDKNVLAHFEPDEFTLDISVSPENAGTTDPAVGQYVLGVDSVVSLEAIAAEGYRFANWTGGVADADVNLTTVTMNGNKQIVANFIKLGDVRITTDPPGRSIVVDGESYIAPQDFEWEAGSVHTIAISEDSTTQFSGQGTRYQFDTWSDDGAQSHNITVNGVLVYSALFDTEYLLTTAVDPEEGGTVTPPAPGDWYAAEAKVELVAEPDTANGFRFIGWTGDLTGKATPDTLVMDGPKSVTASFGRLKQVVVATVPESLTVSIDGMKYKTPFTFSWEENSIHTISADTLKSGGTGIRYYFTDWSDEKSREHVVTVKTDTTFTANYMTQFYLSTHVDPEDGGEVTPASPGAWFDMGEEIPVTAIPNEESGYVFVEWSGDLLSESNPDTVVMDSAMTITATFSSGDVDAPELVYAFPAPNSKKVPVNSPVQFKLRDLGTSVNLATLMFTVEGVDVLRNGADQTGGYASVEYKGQSCIVYYEPETAFQPDSTINVHIQCEDTSPVTNSIDSSFTFQTGIASVVHTAKDTLTIAGGIVFDDTTGIAVSIPENALIDTTEISISVVDGYPELPEGSHGMALAIHFGPAGLTFADSVTISIPYTQEVLDSAGVDSPEELTVFYYSVLSGEWTVLEIFSYDENNIYVKVLEFCYLTLGQRQMTIAQPAMPEGQTNLMIDQYYGFATSKVVSTVGETVEYQFSWGDGTASAWSADTTAAHKWSEKGDYAIVAFARSKVDTSMKTSSDTLWVSIIESGIEESKVLPKTFKLEQNYPNPFNPQTTIQYQVPKAANVVIDIYNINGQKIRTLIDDQKAAGFHTAIWDGRNDLGLQVSTGLYFMQMRAGDYVNTIKMSFLK